MLILTRRNGESLQIKIENNEVIEIHIVTVRGKQVKLSFCAPPACRILRKELLSDAVMS